MKIGTNEYRDIHRRVARFCYLCRLENYKKYNLKVKTT